LRTFDVIDQPTQTPTQFLHLFGREHTRWMLRIGELDGDVHERAATEM
jgi:hypothetical protein